MQRWSVLDDVDVDGVSQMELHVLLYKPTLQNNSIVDEGEKVVRPLLVPLYLFYLEHFSFSLQTNFMFV